MEEEKWRSRKTRISWCEAIIFIFVARRPLSTIKRDLGPQKQFFAIFSENTDFFEKTAKYKNIQYLICDKKSYVNFWHMAPPFPKKL